MASEEKRKLAPTFQDAEPGFGPAPPIHITPPGQSYEAFMADSREQAATTPEGRLTLLRAEKARREAMAQKKAELERLKAIRNQRRETEISDSILTTAVPTGQPYIDGVDLPAIKDPEKRERYRQGVVRAGARTPDHPDSLMFNRAQEGVDFRKGLAFTDRLKQAVNIDVPTTQKQVMEEIMADHLAQIPDGYPWARVNATTGDVEFLRPVTEADVQSGYEAEGTAGKFRWHSARASGMTAASLANLFDLAEVGSVAGGVAGSMATRNLTFFKNTAEAAGLVDKASAVRRIGRGTKGLGGEGLAAMGGREVGNLIKLFISKAQGRDVPMEEVVALMKSDAGREIATAVLGRAAGRGLDTARDVASGVSAGVRGLTIVPGTVEDVAARQAAFEQTAKDNEIINAQLAGAGRKEHVTTTLGEAETVVREGAPGRADAPSGQAERLNAEADRRRNMGQGGQAAERDRQSDTRAGLQALSEFAGGEAAPLPAAASLNRAVQQTERLRLRPVEGSPERGWIGPESLNREPAGATNGLLFEVQNESMKVVSSQLPEGLRGVGLGEDIYKSYIDLALKEGKQAKSGGRVSVDADAVWTKMEADGLPVRKNPNAVRDGDDWIVKDADGNLDPNASVWETPKVEPTTRKVLALRDARTRDAKGRMAKGEGFNRVRTNATPQELAAIKNETSQNLSLRADMAEALFEDYMKKVSPDGVKFSPKARDEWFKESNRILDAVLGPEAVAIRDGAPIQFRTVVEDLQNRKNALQTGWESLLKGAGKPDFRDNVSLLKQVRDMPSRRRKRAFTIMQNTAPEQYAALQNSLKNEIRENMYKPVGTGTTKAKSKTFGKWLESNNTVIADMFGNEYVENLYRFNRAVFREASRQGAKGIPKVTNTPGLMAARTVMGVMNKWQRRVTAVRRAQMQKWYGRTLDIVGDPDRLQQLVSIQEMQQRLGPESRAVSQALIRLGLVDNEEDLNNFNQFVGDWANTVAEDFDGEYTK